MGYTIESVIVFPLSIVILLQFLTSGIYFYERISHQSKAEANAVYYSYVNRESYQWISITDKDRVYQTYAVAVNPVKIKDSIDVFSDAGAVLSEKIPVIQQLKEWVRYESEKK